MSLLKAIKAQLGLSNTPANNFTITAEADNGTLKLARGNAGATTQDLITVSASNVVTGGSGAVLVGNGPAFSANLSANQSFSVDSPVKVLFNAEKFDTNNAFDTTTSRFQPTTPGYYLVATSVLIAGTGIGAAVVYLHKNGVAEHTLAQLNTSISGGVFMGAGSCVVYLNGTTDYLEVFGTCIATSGRAFSSASHFSGFLARAA